MRPVVTAAVLVLLWVGGCSEPAAEGPEGSVVVSFGDREVGDREVVAEVAATPSERGRGLQHRDHLPRDAGMLFLFPERREGGFWMKDTLIPLSIAFLREDGREGDVARYEVVAILDMEPCEADPCPSYEPGLPYDAALEVNQSWFAEAGVEVGDRARVEGRDGAGRNG